MLWLALAGLMVTGASSTYDGAMTKAVALYNDAEWDASLRELSIAEQLAKSDAQRTRVWLHQGVVFANVPDPTAAKASWRRALELEPRGELPLPVSPRVKVLFDEARKEAAQARADAPRRPSLTANPNEAPFPLVPILSLGGALVAGGVGLGFAVSANSMLATARTLMEPDATQLRNRAGTQSTVAYVAFAVAGAAALAALITFIVMD
ncbi:MAG: hypothetical protein IPJ65_35970 [Archangiaceae bacterium]|nr:hypothetical protein [Archangiaceae bacterium]